MGYDSTIKDCKIVQVPEGSVYGRHSKVEKAVVELPEEILIEILFRLPVKSLLKFKTVCKSWYSIIKSKQFVKRQLNHAHSTLYDQHKDFLGLLQIPSSDDSTRCVLFNQNLDGIIYARQFDLPFKLNDVCNYCDGLICFALSKRDILIWNPSLPMEHHNIQMKYKTKDDLFWVGMGYDSTTDDYKIVDVPEGRWNAKSRTFFVKVFSLKSRSWSKKKISKNFTYEICESKTFYTRNRLHWIGKFYDDSKSMGSIIYFDVVEERLDLVNFPAVKYAEMFNYKDSLAIIDSGSLWVLEEYNGMKSSWSKLFELPDFKYHVDIEPFKYCNLCFTREGKILIKPMRYINIAGARYIGDGLRTYDLQDGYVMNVEIRGDGGIMHQKESISKTFDLSSYVESLISPKWFE